MKGLSSISRSAVGLVRAQNEDAVLADAERGFFVVADGMGGGAEGARASRMVCEALARDVRADGFALRLDQMRTALCAANRDIAAYARAHRLRTMGSTVALLAFESAEAERAVIAYVGDSRVYRLRAGRADRLTRDHSVGAELAESVGGSFGARFDARSNPLAHVLTRAVGVSREVEIEWRKADVRPGDVFLVCTDGVHDVVATDDLPHLLGGDDLTASADRLEAEIVRKGAPDNYSFILIRVG